MIGRRHTVRGHCTHRNVVDSLQKGNGIRIEGVAQMHSNDCPYCSQARKTGGTYCSKHGSDMSSLDSGVFLINSDKIEECDWHQTRLVMNFNLDADQIYQVDSREHNVKPDRYLLINEGQWFRTSASFDKPARMLTLAFKVGLAGDMYSTLTRDDSYLLDHPENKTAPLFIFDKTYPVDDFLHRVSTRFSNPDMAIDSDTLSDTMENVLQHVLHQQAGVQRDIQRIGAAKLSTRQEIYRRLSWTKDFIEDRLSTPLSTEELAQHACLSLYHFKRLFKEVHGVAPYQYIKMRRLARARQLLTAGYSVGETCKLSGWQDAASFIRSYKKSRGTTPGAEKDRS
jgi:AraC family transcriptional regulator